MERSQFLKTSREVMAYRRGIGKRAGADLANVRLIDGRAPGDSNDQVFLDNSLVECPPPAVGRYCSAVFETAVGFPSVRRDDAKTFYALVDSLQDESIADWDEMPAEFGTVQVASKPALLEALPPPKQLTGAFMGALAAAMVMLLLAAVRAFSLTPEASRAALEGGSRMKAIGEHKTKLAKLALGLVDSYTDILFSLEVFYVADVRGGIFTLIFQLSATFLVVPIFANLVASVAAYMCHMQLLRADIVNANAIVYAVCLILSSLNVEALVVLPWTERTYDGYPRMYMLGLTYLTVVLEDVPQLALQILYVLKHGGGGIAAYSIAFSLTSLCIRVIARALVMVTSTATETAEPEISDGIEMAERTTGRGKRSPSVASAISDVLWVSAEETGTDSLSRQNRVGTVYTANPLVASTGTAAENGRPENKLLG